MKRRPRRARPGKDDKPYCAWLEQQKCCSPGGTCRGKASVHHPRQYARGIGVRAPDAKGIPLCDSCHRQGLHLHKGPFLDWSIEEIQAWEREQIAIHRARYAAHIAAGSTADAPQEAVF